MSIDFWKYFIDFQSDKSCMFSRKSGLFWAEKPQTGKNVQFFKLTNWDMMVRFFGEFWRRFRLPAVGGMVVGGRRKKKGVEGRAAHPPRPLNDYYGPAPFRCEQSEATEPLSFSAVVSFGAAPFRRKRSAAAESTPYLAHAIIARLLCRTLHITPAEMLGC